MRRLSSQENQMDSIDKMLEELDNFVLEKEIMIDVKCFKDKKRRKLLAMKLEEFERNFGRVDAHTFNEIIKI
jgi:hypothetical protein